MAWVLTGAAFAGEPLLAAPEAPWLGVALEPGARGVRVREVVDGTAAARAGVQVGDEILAIEGRATAGEQALATALRGRRVGDAVALTIRRGRREATVVTRLEGGLDGEQLLHRRLVGKPAPDFDLPVVGGDGTGHLAAFAGQVVLIEFWSTWCRACIATHPALAQVTADGVRDGAVVLAISDEADPVLQSFVNRQGPGFAVLHDRGGLVRRAFFAAQLPTIVVIDRSGTVRYAGQGDGVNLDHALFAVERALRGSRAGDYREPPAAADSAAVDVSGP
jgi:cytochrome c biogenesis protein CcmG/thiol:disulfide interchange protein DsbE